MSVLDKSIREFDEKLELELDGNEDIVIEDSSNNWRVRFETLKNWILSKIEQYLGFKIAPKTPRINLGQKSENFTLNLENDARYTVEVIQNLRISVSDLTDEHSATVLLELIVGASVTEILWDADFTVNNWAGKNILNPVGGKKYLISFNTDGIDKNRVVISWRSMGDTEGDSIEPFTNLTDGATVTWNSLTGLKKNLITNRASVQLDVTNVENGMVGQLNLTYDGASLNLGLPAGSETIGKFTNLGIGDYVIVWNYNGANFRFINYKMIPEIVSVISADDTQLLVETVNGIATISLVESGIDHQSITGAGTNTHANIDDHIGSSLNPHTVTLEQASTAGNKFNKEVHVGDATTQYRIRFLAEPQVDTDAATMGYVNAMAQGLKLRPEVDVATLVNLNATPSGSGVGKKLTFVADGVQTIDTIQLTIGMRVLVKNQTNPVDNGVYDVTDPGSPSTKVELTRSTHFDGDPTWEVTVGSFHFVKFGNIDGSGNKNSGWAVSGTGAIVVDTDPINFIQFSGAGSYTGSNGISQSGTNFTFNASEVAEDNLEQGTEAYNLRVKNYTAIDGTTVLRQEKKTGVSLSVGNNEITHILGVKEVSVEVYDEADDTGVELGVQPVSTTRVDLYTDIAFTATILIKG